MCLLNEGAAQSEPFSLSSQVSCRAPISGAPPTPPPLTPAAHLGEKTPHPGPTSPQPSDLSLLVHSLDLFPLHRGKAARVHSERKCVFLPTSLTKDSIIKLPAFQVG